MQNLTPKQIAILTAMKKIGGPSGVQKIMTESQGMESKIQVKNILDELVDLKAVVFQSNSQYRATPEALKNITTPSTPAAIAVKPEAYQAKIKSLQAEIDTLKAHIKEAAKHASSQADHLYNLKSALGITVNGQLTIKQAAVIRSELEKEKQNSIQWLRHIADIREAAGDKGKLPLSEFIEYLAQMHNDLKEERATASELRSKFKDVRIALGCSGLRTWPEFIEYLEKTHEKYLNRNHLTAELEGIAKQVNYQPKEHDSISMAVACALEKQRSITTIESIQHLSELIGSIFDDQTRMVIFPTGFESEIIVHDSRFVIPIGVSDETDQFIEALSWISGQYIADEAA